MVCEFIKLLQMLSQIKIFGTVPQKFTVLVQE